MIISGDLPMMNHRSGVANMRFSHGRCLKKNVLKSLRYYTVNLTAINHLQKSTNDYWIKVDTCVRSARCTVFFAAWVKAVIDASSGQRSTTLFQGYWPRRLMMYGLGIVCRRGNSEASGMMTKLEL